MALVAGLWTLDSGRWTMDAGLGTLDSGRWTLAAGFLTLDPERYTVGVKTLKSKTVQRFGNNRAISVTSFLNS